MGIISTIKNCFGLPSGATVGGLTTTTTSGTFTAPSSGSYTVTTGTAATTISLPAGTSVSLPAGQTITGPLTTITTTSFPAILTSQEVKELEDLENAHKEAHKIEKLNTFKKMPSETRQFVINMILFGEAVSAIKTAPPPEQSERLKELQLKKSYSGGYYYGQLNVSPYITTMNLDISVFLPDGITAEDLKNAHVEASLEEQMLGNDNV